MILLANNRVGFFVPRHFLANFPTSCYYLLAVFKPVEYPTLNLRLQINKSQIKA